MSSSKSSNSDHAPATHHLVSEEGAGQRLDKVLSGLPGVLSREMAARLIDQGAVRVNDSDCNRSRRLKAGDRVSFSIPPPEASALTPEPAALEVLFEDAWLVVLNKPPGVPMHPGPGHRQGTLVNQLLAHCGDLSGLGGTLRPGIVHRLDKDTSGLVVAAKNDTAHHHLASQFKAHTIERGYAALVVGRPKEKQGRIDLPLGRQPANRFKRGVNAQGKRAVTHWEVERRWRELAMLRLRLETGRTHQIRVHLSEAGLPVLGDPLYGRARHRGLALEPPLMAALEAFPRQALHAERLGFDHPDSGERLAFAVPLPPDMQALVELLEAAEQPPGASRGS